MLCDVYADRIERLPEGERRERPAGDAYTVMEPVGVVAAIVPRSAPLNLSALKVAPAPAAGCSVILKCAPSTHLNALFFTACLDAGRFPVRVVRVLQTRRELWTVDVWHRVYTAVVARS